MTRLFISLYLDEDVDVLLADLLRARGFDVMTTQQARQVGKSDAEQIAFAVAQRRTLFTHNRIDFEMICAQMLKEGVHFGIMIAVRHTPHKVAQRALKILNHITADKMENQLIYL